MWARLWVLGCGVVQRHEAVEALEVRRDRGLGLGKIAEQEPRHTRAEKHGAGHD
jgi:hypothetical protein